MIKSHKKIIFLFAFIILSSLVFYSQDTTLASKGVNIRMSVPGGGRPPQDTDNSPTVANVSSSVGYTTASITWNSTDDNNVNSHVFVYGLTTAYGQSASPIGTVPTKSGSFSVNLTGLATGTLYYYKITAVDSASQSNEYAGSFNTNSYVVPPDTTPPIISNIATSTGLNSAVITFNTNENATVQVNYGTSTSFGSTATGGVTATTNHTINLLGLSSNKTYFFQITATDVALNSAQSSVLNFKTLADTTPPPDVSGLTISSTTNSFSLSWTNPSSTFTPDFFRVKILRKENSQPSGPSDSSATVVYNNNGESVTDSSVNVNTTYYYTAYSYDNDLNYSAGIFVSGRIHQVITENCTNDIDDDGNNLIDCSDPSCENVLACQPPPVENCTNGIDDDSNGLIDCLDLACKDVDPICNPPTLIEDCKNGIDDNADGKIDCADPTCASACQVVQLPACSDGADNDSDSKIDFPADPGCTDALDNDEYNPQDKTVGTTEQVSFDKIKFLAGSRQIELIPKWTTVYGLANSNLSLSIRRNIFFDVPSKLVLRVGDSDQHQFALNSNKDTYYADVLFPSTGKTQAYVEITYSTGLFDSIEVNLQALNFGSIKDNDDQIVSGAEITLHDDKGKVFPAQTFGQQNPQISTGDGRFGWIVPNGQYHIVAKNDKFYDYSSPIFTVSNNVVNSAITLVKTPPKLEDVIDPDANLAVNIANVAENLAEKTTAAAARAVQQITDVASVVNQITADPTVKKAANTVAPTAVGVVAVGTAALVSWADILPLLRFLFLQPLLLFGRGKREKFGTVYNSLSKLPVDLVIMRLVNLDTNKIVQTKVTSSDGHYFFVVNEGRYRLEARKGSFVFPTSLLADMQTDGNRLDIYHGEEIKVTDKGSVITANIPLDPAGEIAKSHTRLVWNKISRRLQGAVSWIGFIVTVVSLYISPTWYMWVLLGVHIGLGLFFRRLSKPPISKGWGIVYDVKDKKPLSKVVARLFDAKFNKLVASEVTENDGKYFFMAGDNKYYISLEREGYAPIKTDIIDLQGKEAQTIAQDVGLAKKDGE